VVGTCLGNNQDNFYVTSNCQQVICQLARHDSLNIDTATKNSPQVKISQSFFFLGGILELYTLLNSMGQLADLL